MPISRVRVATAAARTPYDPDCSKSDCESTVHVQQDRRECERALLPPAKRLSRVAMSKTGAVRSKPAIEARTAFVWASAVTAGSHAERDHGIRALRVRKVDVELWLECRCAGAESEPSAMTRVGRDADDGDRWSRWRRAQLASERPAIRPQTSGGGLADDSHRWSVQCIGSREIAAADDANTKIGQGTRICAVPPHHESLRVGDDAVGRRQESNPSRPREHARPPNRGVFHTGQRAQPFDGAVRRPRRAVPASRNDRPGAPCAPSTVESVRNSKSVPVSAAKLCSINSAAAASTKAAVISTPANTRAPRDARAIRAEAMASRTLTLPSTPNRRQTEEQPAQQRLSPPSSPTPTCRSTPRRRRGRRCCLIATALA